VLDSLALAYRQAVLAAQSLSGRHADVVHVVGGGSQNQLLCQLTADAIGLPVVAGPAEATALGNVLVQARALGAAPGSLDEMRQLVRSGVSGAGLRRYVPSGNGRAWGEAERRAGLSLLLPTLSRHSTAATRARKVGCAPGHGVRCQHPDR
jgi:rhamnulokinase